jgi:hypothetical protein
MERFLRNPKTVTWPYLITPKNLFSNTLLMPGLHILSRPDIKRSILKSALP